MWVNPFFSSGDVCQFVDRFLLQINVLLPHIAHNIVENGRMQHLLEHGVGWAVRRNRKRHPTIALSPVVPSIRPLA